MLWEESFCWKTPIAMAYTRGHFSALIPMEVDMYENVGAGANVETNDDAQIAYLPLMDSEGKLLPVHFLQGSQVSSVVKVNSFSLWVKKFNCSISLKL